MTKILLSPKISIGRYFLLVKISAYMAAPIHIGGIVILSTHVGQQFNAAIKFYGKKCGIAANFNSSCSVGQRMEEQMDK